MAERALADFARAWCTTQCAKARPRRPPVWRDAGVDTVRLYPAGDTLEAKLHTLGRAIELAGET